MGDRALITGGAGFIGAHLARRLIAGGADVVLLDDFSRGRADAELAELTRSARLVRHDLTGPLPDRTLAGGFDAVYHLAAVVGVDNVTADPLRTLRVNLASTLHLLDWCRRQPPARLFLSSTSEVADGAAESGLAAYPLPESVPFVLTTPRAARSAYALSKMAAEALVLHLVGPTQVRIGRFHNVYGPRMGHSHVIPQLTARLLGGEDPLRLFGATQRRAFCYVSDAVEATLRLTALTDPDPVVANIGNDTEETTIADLASRLAALTGRSPRVEEHPAPAGSPPRRWPDLSVLRARTGYQPAVDLAAGLAVTVEWYTRALTETGPPGA